MIGYKFEPIIACNFSVIFEGLGQDFNLSSSGGNNPDRVGFSKIFGLDQEITVTEVVQGSYPETVDIPGRIKRGAITFERGMSQAPSGQALYQWFLGTMNLLHTQVVPAPEWLSYEDTNARQVIRKRDVTIEIPVHHASSASSPGILVKLIQAWPTRFNLGPLDARENTVWISSMELRCAEILVEYANGG